MNRTILVAVVVFAVAGCGSKKRGPAWDEILAGYCREVDEFEVEVSQDFKHIAERVEKVPTTELGNLDGYKVQGEIVPDEVVIAREHRRDCKDIERDLIRLEGLLRGFVKGAMSIEGPERPGFDLPIDLGDLRVSVCGGHPDTKEEYAKEAAAVREAGAKTDKMFKDTLAECAKAGWKAR
jgi:hypothetical protein